MKNCDLWWGTSQKSPVNNFKWTRKLEIFSTKYIKKQYKVSDKGYILEIDDEYPKRLHEKHKDLPFMPEKLNINKVKKLTLNFITIT